MMYYTVNDDTGLIMESSNICPDPQEQADFFGAPVYIIEGQHTGLTATPAASKLTDSAKEPTLEERMRLDREKLLAWTGVVPEAGE